MPRWQPVLGRAAKVPDMNVPSVQVAKSAIHSHSMNLTTGLLLDQFPPDKVEANRTLDLSTFNLNLDPPPDLVELLSMYGKGAFFRRMKMRRSFYVTRLKLTQKRWRIWAMISIMRKRLFQSHFLTAIRMDRPRT